MSPARMSRIESGIRIVLEFKEAFNQHDIVGIMKLISEDGVFETNYPAPDGAKYSGKDAIAQFWQDFFHNSPHASLEIEEIFSFGFRCILRWTYHWADGSGNPGHLRGVDIFRVKNGSICEMLSYVKG